MPNLSLPSRDQVWQVDVELVESKECREVTLNLLHYMLRVVPRPHRAISLIPARRISGEASHAGQHIERIKRPQRGGQNLSQRANRLEKSLRAREARSSFPEMPVNTESGSGSVPLSRAPVEMFHGLVVPRKPKEPGDEGNVTSTTRSFIRADENECRMLYVRMCNMRL